MIERLTNLLRVNIPQVYDESMTYLEFVAAMQAKINELVNTTNTFLNQDLQAFVDAQLLTWLNDGTLAGIIGENLTVADVGDYFVGTTLVEQLQELGSTSSDNSADITALQENFNNFSVTTDPVIINVVNEGVTGNGTDETIAMQAALTKAADNNAVFYVPADLIVSIDCLKLISKNNFKIKIDGWLKRINNASYSDPRARSMIVLDLCYDFEIINYNGDGNVANNGVTIKEHTHQLELAGCYNVKIGNVKGKNLPGDLVYIGEMCHDIQCDNLFGYGSDTGRNTLSIISGYNMQFANIISKGVGTQSMPGGVCVEPNTIDDDCYNLQFGNVYIDSVGTNAFTLSNNPGAECHDVIANNVIIFKRQRTTTGSAFAINKFDNIKITGNASSHIDYKTNSKLNGVTIDGGNMLDIDIDVYNSNIAYRVGYTTLVKGLRLKGYALNSVYWQLDIGNISNCEFNVTLEDCATSGLNNPNLLFEVGATFTNVLFKGCRFIKTNYGYNACYLQGTFNGVRFIECENIGWSNPSFMGYGTMNDFKRINMRGLNEAAAMPNDSNYYWQKGEYVHNTDLSILGTTPNKYIIKGWQRMTSGLGATLNVDWVEDKILTGT